MTEIEYKVASDFDQAWLNLELNLPLPPGNNGAPNPFYVDRPDNPAARLEKQLLLPQSEPPKYFFSGHRGCGKSTELYRLAANPEIRQKYWPVHFTIREYADINDLDYKDILVAVGGQMYNQYRAQGGKLKGELLKELDSWRGNLVQMVTTLTNGRLSDMEIGARLDALFANASLKIKLEPKTRTELRQVFERDITGLINVINLIATGIWVKEKRIPLVLIDDLDKVDHEIAIPIFHGHRETMLQPQCAIVYTVSSSLFYCIEFEAIRSQAIFLPNIKLHPKGQPDQDNPDGYRTLQEFIFKRMRPDLIDEDAVKLVSSMSGGVFRELCRLMRGAIIRAMTDTDKEGKINKEHIEKAATEVRGEYRRILTEEQRRILFSIRQTNQLAHPDKTAPLLQILAALEYNDDTWFDVHPVLGVLLEEMR